MKWADLASPNITEEEIALGDMSINADNQLLTRNVSTVINSLRDTIRVSSYPLALWFAAYWWRLLYEPIPSGEQIEKSYNWKNSHNIVSADNGYIWPNISFISDGQFMTIISSQQFSNSKLPLFYLGSRDPIVIRNDIFIDAIKEFILSTINRLDEFERYNTDLHFLFEQLKNEIEDEGFSLYRRMEAILGYDPDEVPDNIINKIKSISKVFSEDTLIELISTCSINETDCPNKELESALFMTKTGIKGKWMNPISTFEIQDKRLPWDAGRLIARKLRASIGNLNKKIETKTLCDFLGITTKEINNNLPTHNRFSISYFKDDKLYINLKKERSNYYSIGRRFQITRLIGALLACKNENIFISSNCKTYFQKLQRAFAAEFLSPIDEIKNFVEKNVTTETIEKAAKYFSVSPQTIAHSLANHRIISKPQLDELAF